MRAAPGTLLPNVTLCGVDENGADQTNEMSWLTLEVMAQIKLSEPAVYVRYSPDMDPAFIRHALMCNIRFGGGNPAFLNDRLGTRRYIERGILCKDAVNWNAGGCLGVHLDCSEHVAGMYNLNQPMIFELAMFKRYSRKIKKVIGPRTGDFLEFTSFEQVKKPTSNSFPILCRSCAVHLYLLGAPKSWNSPMSGLRVAMHSRLRAPPGLGSREGGCRYPEGVPPGLGTAASSTLPTVWRPSENSPLTRKKITMAQLLEAMEHNWEVTRTTADVPQRAHVTATTTSMSTRSTTSFPRACRRFSRLRSTRSAGKSRFCSGVPRRGTSQSASKSAPCPTAACPVAHQRRCLLRHARMDVNGQPRNQLATNGPYASEYVGYTMNMKFSKNVLNTRKRSTNWAGSSRHS
jgi:formate C-acetyltransferase